MLLTYALPFKDDNQYKLYAVARDKTGHETMFQSRVIVVNNSKNVRPFGNIETPGQGGIVSGSNYVNWGWALTPPPNSIPTDGSTIGVYIDDVYVGRPVYNIFREDIAVLFPGCLNSAGPLGYYIMDTTKYANGIHTISWSVRDSAGKEEGIGSRYFIVRNFP
jgi:hypothetical protein